MNSVHDLITMAFPPSLPSIQHVTINSTAQRDLSLRTGASSIVVPNVLDFETPPGLAEIVDAERPLELDFSVGGYPTGEIRDVLVDSGIEGLESTRFTAEGRPGSVERRPALRREWPGPAGDVRERPHRDRHAYRERTGAQASAGLR